MSGSVTVDDREYWFIMRSGDYDGDVIEAWDDVGVSEFQYHKPTEWALVPMPNEIDSAIASGRGYNLVQQWIIKIKNNKELSTLVQNYSYDRHFQPGGFIEKHYNDMASKHGMRIVDAEEALEIRKRLLA